MRFDAVIVGAGVVGSMLARELSRYRLKVCLLEKENDVGTGASKANSGIIHGGYDPIPGTLKAKLNVEGVELLYQAARELHVPCKNNGAMVCAFGTLEEEQTLQMLLQRGITNGVRGLEMLTGTQARKLEPNLSPAVSAVLHIPTSGIISPYDLTIAAAGNAMDNGVVLIRNFEVVSIQQQDDFLLTAADGRTVVGKYVVNCAGGFSDRIAQMAGDNFFTIVPRAGEYLLLDKTEGGRISHTIFQVPTKSGKGILVTPTAGGNLLVGPTAFPVAAPDSTEVTEEGLEKVKRMGAKSVPGICFHQVITSFAGVRASVSGGDFLIQPSPGVEHLVHVAAIDSPGLTACVAIARYALALLQQQGLVLEEKPVWDGTREDTHAFAQMTESEQDAYIKAHPEYGKIICRCEMVSEGEMRDAIRRNPPAWDLDGIKRRTRGGMGRCQGGFCSPYVMRLLAEELGISMTEVSKNGKGSEPLTGKR